MASDKALRWLIGACLACAFTCLKGCVLSFHDYPVADLCAASRDAGIRPNTAPDPALRGCDAGRAANADPNQELAGAAGMDGDR